MKKWKIIALLSIAVNGIVLTAFLYFFVFGVSSSSSDGRTLVDLSPREKQFVLLEMRQLLESIHEIHTELSLQNKEKAALAAEKVGMQMVRDLAAVEGTLMMKLPAPMKVLGIGTHEQFDSLAKTIRTSRSDKEIYESFRDLTSRCVACHSTYKLVQ